MTKFCVSLLLLAFVIPLRADNWLQNGDFSDGIAHWRGNGRSPDDFNAANPLDKPDPLTSKGLIVELRTASWQKIQQDFKSKLSDGVLTITYLVSDGGTFSNKPDDYENIPQLIDYDGWKAFNIPPQSWIVFLTDMGTNKGTYYTLKPTVGGTGPQTIRAPVSGLTPFADKTICLAFPPGQGKVVILSISIDDK